MGAYDLMSQLREAEAQLREAEDRVTYLLTRAETAERRVEALEIALRELKDNSRSRRHDEKAETGQG